MARIALDLDEVLGDSMSAFVAFHNRTYGTRLSRDDFHTYSFEAILQLPVDQVVTRILEFYNSDRECIEPMPGAREVLEELKADHECIVVTARMDDLADHTSDWIEKEYPGIFQGIYFSHNSHLQCSRTPKHEYCTMHGATVLVDESPEHLIPCAENGVTAILFEQPWNRSLTIEGIERVPSWDVLRHVLRAVTAEG